MNALSTVELVSPPIEDTLKDLGLDNLGEELLQTLRQPPRLLPGDDENHA